jgi:hypothetical protein
MLRFMLDGEKYEYDDTSLTVKEARVIKKNTGFGLVTWAQALQQGDPDALVAMVWLAKTRAGEAVRWQDFDNMDLAALDLIGNVDEDDDSEQEGDDVDPPVTSISPTSSGGRTRKRS